MSDMPQSYIDWQQRRGWMIQCPDCDGSGTRDIWTSSMANPVVSFDCRKCNGTGEVRKQQ